jgi:hypothetical protein
MKADEFGVRFALGCVVIMATVLFSVAYVFYLLLGKK